MVNKKPQMQDVLGVRDIAGTLFMSRLSHQRALGTTRKDGRKSQIFMDGEMTQSVNSLPSIAALRNVHSPFPDMACSSSLAPLASFNRWRGRSTAGSSPLADMQRTSMVKS